MSETTRTPHYQLYKPNVNADSDLWGDHWNSNADTLDSTLWSIAGTAGVTSFNTRIGAVTLQGADVTAALGYTPYNATNPAGYQTAANVTASLGGYAPLASPTFIGDPKAPTPTAGDNDTSIATTAFVTAAVAGAAVAGVASFNTRTGPVTLTSTDVTNALTFTPYNATNPAGYQTAAQVTTALAPYAPLNAPVFTGDARGVTAPPNDNDSSLATTQFVQTATAAAPHNIGRNLLHNPLFNVAQRGAGPWSSGAFTYTADRWQITNNLDTINASIGTMNDTGRSQIGDEAAASYFANTFTGNAGAGAYNLISQAIEKVYRLAGKTVTISFYAVASAALKLGVSLTQYFGTGGSPSASVNTAGQSVTLSTTWTRYSVTFSLPSAAGKIFGTAGNDSTQMWLWYSSGTANATQAGSIGVQSGTINIWGVQLEIGSVATPLEKPDPRYDLANCQRFYQTAAFYMAQYNVAGNGIYTNIYLNTAMRAQPTVTVGSGAVTNASSPSVVALASPTNNVLLAQATVVATGQGFYNGTAIASADL